jgi:hypothetical protein
MKPLCLLYSLFLLVAAWGCTHRSSATLPTPQPLIQPPPTVADKMVGPHAWHGTNTYDGITTPITGSMFIVKINDSTVAFSSTGASTEFTYYKTDSVNGYAIFIDKLGPLSLYYYYLGDSIQYNCDPGGIHDQIITEYTP